MTPSQAAQNLEHSGQALEQLQAEPPGAEGILSPEALAFLQGLIQTFSPKVDALLLARKDAQGAFDAGTLPDFDPDTATLRAAEWTVAPLPAHLADRRVEITGPVDRKMIINALNSGARVFMADFEDSTAPTWSNILLGHQNLKEAVRGTLRFDHPDGRVYTLNEKTATLFVRPRGWHMREAKLRFEGRDVPAALVDFGLFLFWNGAQLVDQGKTPCLYLPKLEHHREARLWNEVFVYAQEALGLARGSIRATVLIETLPAALQMDEILWELREHSAGLNCGRWDYIFSSIKTVRAHADRIFPNRSAITMTQPSMQAYTRLLVKTCHRRGAHAMGGMAAQIPIKNDPKANQAALETVRADKLREVLDGHDGTWVAHPGLVELATRVFDAHMPQANQIEKLPSYEVDSSDLLAVPSGGRSEAGLRQNIDVGLRYLESWLRGRGCVPIYNLMEDAATAEISRAQVWQWLKHGASLDDGRTVTLALLDTIIEEVMAKLWAEMGPQAYAASRFDTARKLFRTLCISPDLTDFLTLPAYALLPSLAQSPQL